MKIYLFFSICILLCAFLEIKAIKKTRYYTQPEINVTYNYYWFLRGENGFIENNTPKRADNTESRIGKRIGFVFNDSVIMAPTINCCIESGGFTINSPDKSLILEIFNSLKSH